eukprot:RCo035034
MSVRWRKGKSIAVPQVIVCPNCQNPNAFSAKFCAFCGQRVASSCSECRAPEPVTEEQAKPTSPVSEQGPIPCQRKQKDPSRSGSLVPSNWRGVVSKASDCATPGTNSTAAVQAHRLKEQLQCALAGSDARQLCRVLVSCNQWMERVGLLTPEAMQRARQEPADPADLFLAHDIRDQWDSECSELYTNACGLYAKLVQRDQCDQSVDDEAAEPAREIAGNWTLDTDNHASAPPPAQDIDPEPIQEEPPASSVPVPTAVSPASAATPGAQTDAKPELGTPLEQLLEAALRSTDPAFVRDVLRRAQALDCSPGSLTTPLHQHASAWLAQLSQLRLKAHLKAKIKVMGVRSGASLAEVRTALGVAFFASSPQRLSSYDLHYKDGDGDLIWVETEEDWKQGVFASDTSKPVNLWLLPAADPETTLLHSSVKNSREHRGTPAVPSPRPLDVPPRAGGVPASALAPAVNPLASTPPLLKVHDALGRTVRFSDIPSCIVIEPAPSIVTPSSRASAQALDPRPLSVPRGVLPLPQPTALPPSASHGEPLFAPGHQHSGMSAASKAAAGWQQRSDALPPGQWQGEVVTELPTVYGMSTVAKRVESPPQGWSSPGSPPLGGDEGARLPVRPQWQPPLDLQLHTVVSAQDTLSGAWSDSLPRAESGLGAPAAGGGQWSRDVALDLHTVKAMDTLRPPVHGQRPAVVASSA